MGKDKIDELWFQELISGCCNYAAIVLHTSFSVWFLGAQDKKKNIYKYKQYITDPDFRQAGRPLSRLHQETIDLGPFLFWPPVGRFPGVKSLKKPSIWARI